MVHGFSSFDVCDSIINITSPLKILQNHSVQCHLNCFRFIEKTGFNNCLFIMKFPHHIHCYKYEIYIIMNKQFHLFLLSLELSIWMSTFSSICIFQKLHHDNNGTYIFLEMEQYPSFQNKTKQYLSNYNIMR